MMKPHEIAMNKAKIALMATPNSVFFTTLAFGLHHKFDSSIRTAATNGKHVLYNPDFFMSLNKDEQVFLILHEAMHVAYMHMLRAEGKDKSTFNEAADYVINLQLVERKFSMPKCGLLNKDFAGMDTEAVYELLMKDPNQQPKTNGIGDDLLPPEDGTIEQATEDIQDILIRAAIQSKVAKDKPGTIPGDIEIYLNNLLNPKLPWTTILRRYIKALDKNDYSFKKPNRRFFPKHYLPSLSNPKLQDIVIAVDTSGSVSDEEFNAFIVEIGAIFRMMKPSKITLIQFDTKIKSVTTIKNFNDLSKVKFYGRGGTDVNDLVHWLNTNTSQISLVFTDGDFNLPHDKVSKPLIWLIHNNPSFKEPFGKAIHYGL